jgi:type II secretory pathway component PulM
MRIVFVLAILLVIILALFWQPDTQLFFTNNDSITEHETSLNRSSAKKTSVVNKGMEETINVTTDATADLINNSDTEQEQTSESFELDPQAINSLREARLYGDSRTPPLFKQAPVEAPTDEEVADHDKFREYEQRQEKRLYQAYALASKEKIAGIQSMIDQAKGKDVGISDTQIEEAEQHIQQIEEMVSEIKQRFPDILDDKYKPTQLTQDWLLNNAESAP